MRQQFAQKIDKALFVFLLSTAVSNCAVGPDFHAPAPPKVHHYTALPLPKRTVQASGGASADRAQRFVQARDLPSAWWRLFHSRTLNRLIALGLANSPTLAAAQANLVQAQQQLRAQIGESYFPAIDLQMVGARDRFSALSFGGGGGRSATFGVYTPTLQATYILDVFGGQRRLVESVAAAVDLAKYQWLGAYVSLTANIATTAIEIASIGSQILATENLIITQQKILDIVQKQYQVGGAALEEVFTQKTQLAQLEATLPPLQKTLAVTQHALAVLVGKFPSQLKPLQIKLSALTLPGRLPVTVPSALVQQRPDILAASAMMHEASAKIGVATANLLPQVTISADLGWISKTLSMLFNYQSYIWSAAVTILQPVFHGGALIAKRREALAAFKKVSETYRETVLKSFKEVADVLRAIDLDAKTYVAQDKALRSANKTLSIATQRFKVGGENYLTVLNAQKSVQEITLKKIQAQGARYIDTAVLFQALGGGWWHHPSVVLPVPHVEKAKHKKRQA